MERRHGQVLSSTLTLGMAATLSLPSTQPSWITGVTVARVTGWPLTPQELTGLTDGGGATGVWTAGEVGQYKKLPDPPPPPPRTTRVAALWAVTWKALWVTRCLRNAGRHLLLPASLSPHQPTALQMEPSDSGGRWQSGFALTSGRWALPLLTAARPRKSSPPTSTPTPNPPLYMVRHSRASKPTPQKNQVNWSSHGTMHTHCELQDQMQGEWDTLPMGNMNKGHLTNLLSF